MTRFNTSIDTEGVSIKISGMDEALKQLGKLPKSVGRSTVLRALRHGGRIIVKDARRRIARIPTLSKSIKMKAIRKSETGQYEHGVRIKPDKSGWFAHFFEWGVKPHKITAKRRKALANTELDEVYGGGVDHPGIPATPFMRPAFDSNFNQVVKDVESNIVKEIEKSLAKLAG